MEHTSEFLNNALYIIDGLADNEMQTASRLYDDMMHVVQNGNQICDHFKVRSINDFNALLEKIKIDCIGGLKPILHFEIHGDATSGLKFVSGELYSWSELITRLREINIATKNNTGVVMAVCHGLNCLKEVSALEPTPFCFLIGSQEILLSGEIEVQIRAFYNELYQGDSLDTAMSKVSEKFRQFIAEKHFLIAIAKYFKNQCMGRGRLDRIENLITQAREEGKIKNRHDLRKARKQFKDRIRPFESDFERLSNRFLHGKKVFKFEEVIDIIKPKSA